MPAAAATRLSLVTLHEYPGMKRFIGLGQLSAPQLGELFKRRIDVSIRNDQCRA